MQVLEYREPRRRPLLDAARRRPLHRARRRDPDCDVRPGPLLQPRPVAHPLSPPRDPRLLQAPRRRARAVHPGQLQRLRAFGRRLRRQAAALSPHPPISTAMSPSCWPRRRGRTGSTRRSPRKTRRSCWRRCASWGALDANYDLCEGGDLTATAAATTGSGRRADRPARAVAADRRSRRAEVAACGARLATGDSTSSRRPCSSRSAAWT